MKPSEWLTEAGSKLLRDENPPKTNPKITKLLISINIMIGTIIGYAEGQGISKATEEVIKFLGLISHPCLLLYEPWRWITHMFIHINWQHLLGNMLFLMVFGDNVEDYYGHRKYFILYLLWGFGAALGQTTAYLLTNTIVAMVGASGAISGILGAYLVLYPDAKITGKMVADKKVPAKVFLGLWFVGQFTSAIMGNAGMVAVIAHICGFILGYITASYYKVEKNVE